MQLLFSRSEEGGDVPGLNIVKGRVQKLMKGNCKIPHIGFNSVQSNSNSLMMKDICTKDFYFVHSYCVERLGDEIVKIFCDHNSKFIYF